jgi:acylglycerol lipase
MFTEFANTGIKVVSFDQRGFGHTVRLNGTHGHNEGIETTMNDIELLCKQTQIPSIPHFLMGHSMGGGLSLLYAHRNPKGLAGVIASAPLVNTGKSNTPSSIELLLLGHVLPRFLSTFVLANKLDISNLSRDENQVQKYLADPLIHDWASIQTRISIHNDSF